MTAQPEPTMPTANYGRFIRRAREKADIQRRDLADMLGLLAEHLRLIELGQRPCDQPLVHTAMRKIAMVLDRRRVAQGIEPLASIGVASAKRHAVPIRAEGEQRQAEERAIADYLASKGVTRCAPAAVAPTTAMLRGGK